MIQRNVCSKHQKFFGCADGQHYTDSILKILAKQNYENSSQPGQSPMSISVHGMNVIHDFVCSFGKNLIHVAVELMQKNGHKTLQARDFAFALDLLMEPGKLRIFTKYAGFKALKKKNQTHSLITSAKNWESTHCLDILIKENSHSESML